MRETGERAGIAERFPPSLLMSQKERSPYYSALGAYILPQPKQNYKKKPKPKAITGDKMGRKPKRGTKVKNSNGQQEQCRRVEK